MTTDYGIDFLCLTDLSPDLRTVTGADLLRQAAYHRITQAALVDDPDWGTDLQEEIGKTEGVEYVQTIALMCSEAIQRDPRIDTVSTRATGQIVGDRLFVMLDIVGTGVNGTDFSLSVLASDASVEILQGVT